MANLISDFILSIKRHAMGPENGPNEVIDQNPAEKYYTGMLVPGDTDDLSISVVPEDPDSEGISDEESDNHESVGIKNYSISSFGLYFDLDGGFMCGSAALDILVSFARYQDERGRYARNQFYKELKMDASSIMNGGTCTVYEDKKIRVLLNIKLSRNGGTRVILFNHKVSKIEHNEMWKYTLFQISLRINAGGHIKQFMKTRIVENDGVSALYYDKKSYGRGFNCAAVWKRLDIERNDRDGQEERLLIWPDYRPEYSNFYSPEIRTEFIPLYQSMTPESAPELDLSASGMIDGSYMETLNSLANDYLSWIKNTAVWLKNMGSYTPPEVYSSLELNINNNKLALERIRGGIDALKGHPDADRAFRFVNAVMDLAGVWRHYDNGFKWRPFQLAFLLLKINDIVNDTREGRDLMDILWVHTGAGKTEAYMAVAIFDIIYRRYTMQASKNILNPGTSVISRYTLRLLTVQQFKRTLEVITAAEYIRTHYNSFNDGSEFPISAGLWVGKNITPNSGSDARRFIRELGNNSHKKNEGNPVQIIKCPACGSLLAIPLDRGLKTGDSFFVNAPNATINQNYTGQKFKIYQCSNHIYHIEALSDVSFYDIANSADFNDLRIDEIYEILLPGYRIVKNKKRSEIMINCNNPNCQLSGMAIPAYTVDEDIYKNHPSFIISTVDKVARLAFDPNASSVFMAGDSYAGPDLIIQDEMHLLTGPMGSMFGVYENAVSALMENHRINYIAASATVNRYQDQVSRLFARKGMLFPPGGISSSDSYFFKTPENLDPGDINPDGPGRVYMGIMATGTSMQSALIDIITNIIKTKYRNETDTDIKYFWTPVLYFNSIKELSIAESLYHEDVMQRINVAGNIYLDPFNVEGLSSRAGSQDIPLILERLEAWDQKSIRTNADALITTSMFGTGVDISRLSLMVVSGQPKMTSEYIQATGRVGRSKKALVVILYNIARPRDRSHYEMFLQYHDRIHAFVENSPVSPWSTGSMNRAAGPAFVAYARALDPNLRPPGSARDIVSSRATVSNFLDFTKNRIRCTNSQQIADNYGRIIDKWISIAKSGPQNFGFSNSHMIYRGQNSASGKCYNAVVLGMPQDKYLQSRPMIVYENALQSLRDVEESGNFNGFCIRTSQFVFGYGPGALIEGNEFASVIMADRIYKIRQKGISTILDHFDLTPRLNSHVNMLLKAVFGSGNDIHVLELPSNQAILPDKPGDVLYDTGYFPSWRVCTNDPAHKKLGINASILYHSSNEKKECPVCHYEKYSTQTRFIMACPAGHMDDMAWHYAVHGSGIQHRPAYYLWIQKSQSLKSIQIKCPVCQKSKSMHDVYSISFKCTGRFPERGAQKSNSGNQCNYKMHVVQRQASSLRYPNVYMILNLPQQGTLAQLPHNVLQTIANFIDKNHNVQVIKDFLGSMIGTLINDRQYDDIKSRYGLDTPGDINKLADAINKIINQNTGQAGIGSIMQMEFEFLYNSCEYRIQDPQNDKFRLTGPFNSENLNGFKYAGVEQIEMLIMQPSYVRNIRDSKNSNAPPQIVESAFNFNGNKYIPGMINNGDAIFIYTTPAGMEKIMQKYMKPDYKWFPVTDNNITRNWGNYTNSEEFTMLHTVSHALIRAVSYRTGYSLASLRERVYSTQAGYGILIYSNLPGSDGSTGGLTDLVKERLLDEIIGDAAGYINECSNDPFCSDKKWNPKEGNGAACYSCIMLPETSCEYYNTFLDRNIWVF